MSGAGIGEDQRPQFEQVGCFGDNPGVTGQDG